MTGSTGGVVAVTGAAGGIGEAIARRFAELGSSVVLVDWNADLLAATTSRLAGGGSGGAVSSLVADVSDSDDARRIVEEAVGRYGGLDAAVTVPKPVDELDDREWDKALGVNLKAIFLTSKNAIPRMRQRGGGVIVNIASVDAYVAEGSIPAYCAAKGGVLNLTRALALDYAADNIRVNCVCPGMTGTPLFRSFMAQAGSG